MILITFCIIYDTTCFCLHPFPLLFTTKSCYIVFSHSSSDCSVRKGLLWSTSVMPSCFHEHRLHLHRDLLTLLWFFPFSLVTVNSCFFCSMLYSLQLFLCTKINNVIILHQRLCFKPIKTQSYPLRKKDTKAVTVLL